MLLNRSLQFALKRVSFKVVTVKSSSQHCHYRQGLTVHLLEFYNCYELITGYLIIICLAIASQVLYKYISNWSTKEILLKKISIWVLLFRFLKNHRQTILNLATVCKLKMLIVTQQPVVSTLTLLIHSQKSNRNSDVSFHFDKQSVG